MDYPGGDPRFEVYCSGAIAKSIEEVHQQALDEGRGQAMVDAFTLAVQRLQQDPNNFGEALFRLPALRMIVRTAVVLPIAIDFAVCVDRPMVFIKGVQLLSK